MRERTEEMRCVQMRKNGIYPKVSENSNKKSSDTYHLCESCVKSHVEKKKNGIRAVRLTKRTHPNYTHISI